MKYANSSRFLINSKDFISHVYNKISYLYDLIFPSIPACVYCGADIKEEFVCDECKSIIDQEIAENNIEDVYSCYYYSEEIKNLVAKYKFELNEYLCEYISNEIYTLIKKENIQADMITYVPLHKKRERERGYNQSKIIAKDLSLKCDIQCVSCLERTKKTKQQAHLSAENRIKNVKNAFIIKINRYFIGKSVIIVDDIITTGSTIGECKNLLLKAGAKRVICISFAKSKFQNVFSPKFLGEE